MFSIEWIPATVRIILVFLLVVLAIRKKVAIGAAFLTGAAALGILFGMSFVGFFNSAGASLFHPKTLSLSAVVLLILVLSHSMESAGQMKRLLDSFQGLIRHPGINLVFFPAIIGLLPMPGGAVFSAPMVKSIGEGRNLSGARLSYINYWFRHIWEYWWPLYPGVLLTTALAGLNLWTYVLCLFPLTVVATAVGSIPVRDALGYGAVRESEGRAVQEKVELSRFLAELAPILISIVGGLGLGFLFSFVPALRELQVSKETGLVVALSAAIGWAWKANRLSARARKDLLCNKELLDMFFMVASILVFQGTLEKCGAVGLLGKDLIALEIPLMSIAIILPFIVGMVAGITIAFVGATFPIIISLVHAYGESQAMMAYMALGIASGFVGVLLSPLHLCFVLSNGYFKTSSTEVYPYLLYPCVALIVSVVVYFFGLRIWLG